MAVPYAKVCIWLPGGMAYFMGAGHAALKIMRASGEKYYITWLASRSGCSASTGSGGMFTSQSAEAPKCLGFTTIRNRHTGAVEPNPDALGSGNEFTYYADKRANAPRFGLNGPYDSISATYKFEVPVMKVVAVTPTDNVFGINVDTIARWWKHLLSLPPGHPRRRYGMFSTEQNCCGVVVQALLKGGLGAYVDPPENFIYQGARTLLSWVRRAVDEINKMNQESQKVAIMIQGMPPLLPQEVRMPTLDEWKSMSSLKKWYQFGRRIEQVARIDTLIPKYHQAVAQNDSKEMLRNLVEIHAQVFSHLVLKPDSNRREGVMKLGQIVRALLQKNQAQYQQIYDTQIAAAP